MQARASAPTRTPFEALRLTVIALFAGALGSLPARASERYRAWQAEHPFTQSAWETHRYQGGEEVDLPYFTGSGLNTFWDGVRGGTETSRHPHSRGLPALLLPELRSLELFQADFKEAQQVHSKLIGIVLGDEVEPDRAKGLRPIRDWLVNNPDPRLAALLTISSVPPMSLEDYDKLKGTLEPDVFLFQHYPDMRSQDWQSGYFSLLERWFAWTRAHDVGFWVYPRVYSSTHDGIASESELRLQRFTALAYGVKGLVDFMWPCYSPPSVPGAGYWDGSGQPTAMYQCLAPINREIARLATSLVRLTPVGAYHLNRTGTPDSFVRHWMDPDSDQPTWLRRTWQLVNVSGTTNRNHVVVGFFRDDAGQEYFLVVNKDAAPGKTGAELAGEINLTFQPQVQGIQRWRRTDGTVERLAVNRNYTFSLPGGTGDLFKVDTGTPFAGSEPITLPALLSVEPTEQSTLSRLQNNRLILHFDAAATQVAAEIRELDDQGQLSGADLSDSFTRSLSADRRTVIYQESGQVLKNRRTYRVVLHWAKGRESLLVRTCRGDVDGDGQASQKDLELLREAALDPARAEARADLDGDGAATAADVDLLTRLLRPAGTFRWEDDFETYAAGPLSGQGPWLAIETLPARVVTKAVVQGPATVTGEQPPLRGAQKLQGGVYPDYRGNEAVFRQDGGVGDTGILRLGFMARLGASGVERMLLNIANSRDAEGSTGVLCCDVLESDSSRLYTTRGVTLLDASNGPKGDVFQELSAQQGVQVQVTADFDAKTLTWEARNLQTGKQYGPRTVHYQGRFAGLDSVSFWICGQGTQIDSLWVQDY